MVNFLGDFEFQKNKLNWISYLISFTNYKYQQFFLLKTENVCGVLSNITNYVLKYDVTLNDGETIGLSATQKWKISESKGIYLEGATLKIKY